MVKPPSRHSSRLGRPDRGKSGATTRATTSAGRGHERSPSDEPRAKAPKPTGPRAKLSARAASGADERAEHRPDQPNRAKPYGANPSAPKPYAGDKRGAGRNPKPYGDRPHSDKQPYAGDKRGAGRQDKPFGDRPWLAKLAGEHAPRDDNRGKPREGGATPARPRNSGDVRTPPRIAPVVAANVFDGGAPHVIAEKGERIAKLLARAGIASRREVERLIAEGRVSIDGVVIETPATILTSLAGITVDGDAVRAPDAGRLWAFNKPPGLITAERDPAGRPTIYTALRNALPAGTPRLMPVGRLDLNTEGLLLLTNDGELKRAMELPSSLVPRTYRARTFGDITQDQLEDLMQGIEIEGIRYGSINANMERSTGRNQWIEVTLSEGKNREVRRVLEHLGLQVSRLIRISYGPFLLDDLPRGMAVPIRQHDVENFRKSLKKVAG